MALSKKSRAVLREMRNPTPSSRVKFFRGLGDDFQVPWNFALLVKKQIAELTPFMVHGRKYTTGQLLGAADLLAELNNAEARMAELAINDLVKHGEVALAAAGRSSNGAANFVLVTR